MLHLRKLLTDRAEWFERSLSVLAELDGYGDLPSPLVQMCKYIGKDPVRMTVLAEHLGVSRQRVAQIAGEGCERGILELSDDPDDGRVKRVGFSVEGWAVARKAAARMVQIEGELARRIGRRNLEKLCELLSMDWGPPSTVARQGVRVDPPSSVTLQLDPQINASVLSQAPSEPSP